MFVLNRRHHVHRVTRAVQQQKMLSAKDNNCVSSDGKFSYANFVLLTSLSVSLFIHKIVHLMFDPNAYDLDYSNKMTYIWLPSVFISDFIFLTTSAIIVLFVLGPTSNIKSRIVCGNRWIIALVAFLITMLESTCLVTQREVFDWPMFIDLILNDWQAMKVILVAGVSSNNNTLTWMVCVCLIQVVLTVKVSNYLYNKKKMMLDNEVSNNKVNKKRRSCKVRKGWIFVVVSLASASIIAQMTRPEFPYSHLSHTPIIWVVKQVMDSVENKKLMRMKKQDHEVMMQFLAPQEEEPRVGSTGATEDQPHQEPAAVNVVLIFLESVRADTMPFDKSTAWAKKYIKLNRGVSLTPFYENLTKDPSTLHVHHKSASGITHKALVSSLCSLYAKPQKMTQEHKSIFYHQCLPRRLESSGLTVSPFFQSSTKDFDYFEELLHNIGYEKVYAVEDYDLEHDPDEQWKKDHKVDAFSIYTDDVFIKPMTNWIDSTTQRESSSNSIQMEKPFFMTFLTGITHWPYGSPPKGANWNNTSYTARPAFNNMLNGIAYTDRFLSMVFDEFEERSLMNSTLFVIAGDHGVNFKHRRGQMSTARQEGEESFDVAVTFHSKNEEIAKRINTVKSSVSAGVGKSPSSRSSIDIMPTILDFLNVFGKNETSGLDILNGTNTHSVVDGRSMLRPDSNNRLTFSICNPGDKMILRDRSYAIVVGNFWQKRMDFIPKVWDLSKDPQQQTDTLIDKEILRKFKENKLKDFTGDQKDLFHWGIQALKFVGRVETDLVEAHESGHRCTNCTLFLLNSLETLDQWVEFETLDVSA